MTKQISLFLENKNGRISEVARTLGENGINMKAFSMTETPDFGILRIVVSDLEKAVVVLNDANFAVSITDVVCIECSDRPGALADVLECLASEDIGINYMYAFSEGNLAKFVIKPNDIGKCEAALKKAGCTIV
jgi:hypothetical protein